MGDYTDFEVQYLTDVDQLQTLTTEELGIKVRPDSANLTLVISLSLFARALPVPCHCHLLR